jgi:hypothetical protein
MINRFTKCVRLSPDLPKAKLTGHMFDAPFSGLDSSLTQGAVEADSTLSLSRATGQSHKADARNRLVRKPKPSRFGKCKPSRSMTILDVAGKVGGTEEAGKNFSRDQIRPSQRVKMQETMQRAVAARGPRRPFFRLTWPYK